MHRFYRTRVLAATLLAPPLLAPPLLARAAEAPRAGCYERLYDAAHEGQIVTLATLRVKATQTPMKTPARDSVADADLRIWARGRKERFDTLGACAATAGGLSCGGAVSAAETDICKVKTTGVRNCRVDLGEAGGFEIASRPEGVLVTLEKRLELAPAPYDAGPFLNLSGKDRENRSFLLKRAPVERCE